LHERENEKEHKGEADRTHNDIKPVPQARDDDR